MMLSNVFLVLPVIYAGIYHEWLYFFFALGLLIFSPLYHWYKIKKTKSLAFFIFAKCDVVFAIGAFLYMYYFVYKHSPEHYILTLYGLLSLVVLFFWYGRRANYEKLHPWFHIVAPIVSSIILVLTHT